MDIIIFKKRIAFHCAFLLPVIFACNPADKNASGEENQSQEASRVVIELMVEDEALMDSLINRVGEVNLERYRWKNHLVLFGEAGDTAGITDRVRYSGLNSDIKFYTAPFYVFDRVKHCNDSASGKPWKNYLLTANLVADSTLQNEYMHYHRVQFDEWPEVAKGFCHADFQQLLVYRNGRQLMLVISIPADKNLDDLNPKTEENNPRVVEWNKLMSRYQEGIAGASPGETWVFLDRLE